MHGRNWKYRPLLPCVAEGKVPERVDPYSKIWSQIQIDMNIRSRWNQKTAYGGLWAKNHEDHTTQIFPRPPAMEAPAAKEVLDKEWGKFEKMLAWNLAKVRNKSEVIEEARHKYVKEHFAPLMDICQLKNSELEKKHRKYKGRVVLRGDIVKDDSGSYTIFTEQGSSASQMTAAKIMDIIYRLPSCVGQAADVVSAETQVKMEDAPKSTEDSGIGMSRHLDTSASTQMAKIMVQHDWPRRSSWKKFERSSFGRTVVGKAIWENSIGARLGKSSYLGMLIRAPPDRIILFCVRGWHQIGWQVRKHHSDVESTEQRSRFGRTNIIPWSCILGMYSKTSRNTQTYCWQWQNFVWILNFHRSNKNYQAWKIRIFPRVAMTWKVMPRSVWNELWIVEQTTEQVYKVSTPCLDYHQFNEELKSVGQLSDVSSQIVLKCLYLARFGRPDILWSVHRLARTMTKWTRACDKRLARWSLIFIAQVNTNNIVTKGTLHNNVNSIIWRFWFCKRSWSFKIHVRWNIAHIWKTHLFP